MTLRPGELEAGEAEAIRTVYELGAKYGYGNLIFRLRDAWSASLRIKYGISKEAADRDAGHVCPWCEIDSRTGKKAAPAAPGERSPAPTSPADS
jgi:hypothetical protein